MELGEVLGLQGLTVPSTKEGDLSLIKRAAAGSFTQAAAASYPSPFLDEQKMLRFAKAAHTLPSGLALLITTYIHTSMLLTCNRLEAKIMCACMYVRPLICVFLCNS
jgi:hypothetical protein